MKFIPVPLLFLVLSVFSGCASHQAGLRQQSLDGEWKFTTVFDPSGNDWVVMQVPGNWDATEAYSTHSGIGWYRRSFTPDLSLKGKHIRLRFEAVYHEAEVFLNRERLGKHIGGYTPFEFDVTDKLKFGERNELTVRADNTYERGAWWPWGGISRSVNLIANNPVRLEWQHIRSEPDLEAGTAQIFVRYRIQNSGTEGVEVSIASKLDCCANDSVTTSQFVKAGETKDVEAEFSLDKEQVRLWHFDHPELYTLQTTLTAGGSLQHTQSDRFGIRKIEVTATSFLLNGEPVRLVGFNRVSDDASKFGNTEPDELVNLDIDLMKRAGANMSRIMHYPQSPNFLDRLDEKGILVVCEIPVWQHDPQIITNNPITKQWLAEMINRDYNHPSIIGWSVGNEMRDFIPYATSMMDYVREELDPHRLVTYVSDTSFRGGADEPIDQVDIGMINYYKKWSENTAVQVERWPNKPIFVSEFGLRQLKPHGHFKEGFLESWEKLARGEFPNLVGASLWTLNDYRSDYKGTPESGYRSWGVVDQHRNLKPAYYTIRKLFSPVQTLQVGGKRVTVQTRPSSHVPSYTLRGYKLIWEKDGKSGEIALPELKPDDAAWTAELPVADAIVKLVSPLGYDVDDTINR